MNVCDPGCVGVALVALLMPVVFLRHSSRTSLSMMSGEQSRQLQCALGQGLP